MKKNTFLLIFFVMTIYIYPQNTDNKNDILLKADEIISVLSSNNFENLCNFFDEDSGIYVAERICTYLKYYNHLSYEDIKSNKEYLFFIDDDPSAKWSTTTINFLSSTFAINKNRNYKCSYNSYISEIDWGDDPKDILDIFGDCIFVEYYYEPTGKYGDMDWESIYIIFKKINDEYKLIALTCNYIGI